MYKHVMVVLDSEPALAGLIRGLRDLYALGTRNVLLARPVEAQDVEGLLGQLQEVARTQLEEIKAEVVKLGFSVAVEVPMGSAGVELERLAQERGCDLLLVCGTEKSAWGDLLLAPMAHAVLHFVDHPVLVLHPGDSVDAPFLHHLLHPTDFSSCSERAFAHVRKLVRAGGRRVTLCHVQSGDKLNPYLMDKLPEFNQIDTERLEAMRQELLADGATQVDTRLIDGKPQVELLQLAGEGESSLVVMGTQGRGFFGELMVGSVSHYVARRAAIPVLLVP